ncbi:MAG: hypothetical protein A2Y77_02625, partial [Planctomycetes bacterium RBG_13_62_9]
GSSCIYIGGCGAMARHERELSLSAAMQPGALFAAQTGDGSIRVEGQDTSECRVRATIVAHAMTAEQAAELAEQVDVRLEPDGDGLKVVIAGPRIIHNASYSVSIDAQLPRQTSLNLVTSDGRIHVASITGRVDARTSDGGIEARDIRGDTKLRTSDGGIACTDVNAPTLDLHTSDGSIKLSQAALNHGIARTSDGGITLTDVRGDRIELRTDDGSIRCHGITAANVDCHTSDGGIEIEFTPDTPKALIVNATTSDGSISLTAPPDLSAAIEATTNDGSIHTSLPITIQGKIGKSLHGTIGAGEGKIYLRTSDGSIELK